MKNELNLNEIWTEVKSTVLSSINEDHIETFKEITDGSKLAEIDETNGTGIITVLNKFKQVILKQTFNTVVEEVFQIITNTDWKVVFVVEEDYKGNKKEDEKEKLVQEEILLTDDLNKKYLFKNFMVSKSNRVVYNASLAAASSPGHQGWNPLFIYGGSGMGKTHLVNAIGNHTKSLNPGARIKYIQAADFTRLLHEAFSSEQSKVISNVENIKDEYEKFDMLLVDDIQFMEGKEKTSEVFFYILNSFLMREKQVVITSDKYPEELKEFEKRLLTRFMNGVTLPIAPPDVETAKEIIRNKLIDVHLQEKDFLSETALEFIAQNFSSNVRELESSLNKVIMFSITDDKDKMDLEDIKEIFKGLVKENRRGVTISSIISTVAKYYSVKVSDIKGSTRTKDIAMARHISIYLIRTLLDESLISIANEFGRDHTTIMSSVRKITQLNENDAQYSKAIHEMTRKIVGK